VASTAIAASQEHIDCGPFGNEAGLCASIRLNDIVCLINIDSYVFADLHKSCGGK